MRRSGDTLTVQQRDVAWGPETLQRILLRTPHPTPRRRFPGAGEALSSFIEGEGKALRRGGEWRAGEQGTAGACWGGHSEWAWRELEAARPGRQAQEEQQLEGHQDAQRPGKEAPRPQSRGVSSLLGKTGNSRSAGQGWAGGRGRARTSPGEVRAAARSRPPSSLPWRCSRNRCVGLSGIAVSAPGSHCSGPSAGQVGSQGRAAAWSGQVRGGGRGGRRGAARAGYSVSPSAVASSLTLAAQRLLGHHEGWC